MCNTKLNQCTVDNKMLNSEMCAYFDGIVKLSNILCTSVIINYHVSRLLQEYKHEPDVWL